ncbi:hypothetical protein B5X24_HaOG209104 [Helicoverpa armigera]|nr:hypothetical protein B5X24_HaOG209104 [Helicoverpa armigera]
MMHETACGYLKETCYFFSSKTFQYYSYYKHSFWIAECFQFVNNPTVFIERIGTDLQIVCNGWDDDNPRSIIAGIGLTQFADRPH